MIEHGISVQVHRNPLGTVDLYIIDRQGDHISVAEPVQLVFKGVPEDAIGPGPTIRFPYRIGESFLTSMAETLSDMDVKTESDAKLQGTLEATKYHLEDMRELMKLTPGGK